ncbi:hypothetical protein P153DRAFT_364766 [Dothidotthia symphoricarpi CBS 119687]|uniref:Autophagy protein n=1 Tax=Dothidotthia symphoricarpi CBS 119687 TaxID=1392245 RepID=A0A6A6AN41_9PLEO|nr:uncharacterized protein P153DRAFT_364766 [Dothidotthia symphoricarpi CBS 119687]KAF2132354.1 hypothetical protein P153DRAFT_364766 [Dothidotthia symphoricarpi CBS 119687]
MGWLWSSDAPPNGQENLDPTLRDFLKTEAPTGPKPTLPSQPKQKPVETPTQPQSQTQAQTPTPTDPTKPYVPPQSQFQDGRYAHLWKNYTPQTTIDDRGKSEQDRLRDLVDTYNARQGSVGRAAMENCALEYMEQFECFRNPSSWWSRGTMCHAESMRFNRCYDVQSKFMKALGYLTMDARTPDEDERIQMHADKLYQQMMAQEAEMEKAREEGRPVPNFDSVLSKRKAAASSSSTQDETELWSQIKPESRKEYERKLAELPPEDQEFERLAMLGELRAQTGMAKKVEATFLSERMERMKRKEAGQATLGDTIKNWWGWG